MKKLLSFMMTVIMSVTLFPTAIHAESKADDITPGEVVDRAEAAAEQAPEEMPTMIPGSKWEGKNILFIGDQLVADKIYPEYVGAMLGANVQYHCLSSASIVTLIKGTGKSKTKYTGKNELAPLSVFDVKHKDLVIIHCGYNNRKTALGKLGEQYDEKKKSQRSQNSIAGSMQYAISRTKQLLKLVLNAECPIMVVTVDRVGRSKTIEATAYDEYPEGSGRTLEDLAKMQIAIASHNNVKWCDLYHDSGINRDTWSIYSRSNDPKSIDQVRKNKAGYMNIAETVIRSIRQNYGI